MKEENKGVAKARKHYETANAERADTGRKKSGKEQYRGTAAAMIDARMQGSLHDHVVASFLSFIGRRNSAT